MRGVTISGKTGQTDFKPVRGYLDSSHKTQRLTGDLIALMTRPSLLLFSVRIVATDLI